MARALTQSELARRSGVPRATISAVENGRVVPSVEAAMAIARALETSVEALFDHRASRIDEWVGTPGGPFLMARVGNRRVAYGREPLLAGPLLFDSRMDLAERTLVIATCDPSVRLLEQRLADRGVRLIALARTSRDALELLTGGLVHAAGVHFSSDGGPDANRAAAARTGADLALLTFAAWDVGIAHAREGASVAELVQPRTTWVGRPEGSGAQACLERVLADAGARPALHRVARDHRAVVEIVSSGFAEAGISLRLNANEHRLRFLLVERALYDIAVRGDSLDDARIQALVDAARSEPFREALSALPGIDAARAGEVRRAS